MSERSKEQHDTVGGPDHRFCTREAEGNFPLAMLRRRERGKELVELEPWIVLPGDNGTYIGILRNAEKPGISLSLCELGAEDPNANIVILSHAAIYPGGACGLLTFEDGTDFSLTYAWMGVGDYLVHAELLTQLDDFQSWVEQQRTKFGFVSFGLDGWDGLE